MSEHKKKRIILLLYLLMIFLVFLLFISNTLKSTKNSKSTYSSSVVNFNNGWTDESGQSIKPSTLNKDQLHPVGKRFSIFNTLPDYMEYDHYLIFQSNGLCFNITIDEKELFSYGTESKHIFGNSPGVKLHNILIPKEYAGKKICFNCYTSYNKPFERLTDFIIGSGVSPLKYLIHERLFSLIMCMTIIIIGVLYILLDISFSHVRKNNHGILYLGLFAEIVGLWSLTETHIIDLFIENAQPVYCLSLFLLSLVSIPVCLFLSEIFQYYNRCIFYIAYSISILGFLICLVLYLTRTADFSQTLFISQFIIGIFLLITIFTIMINLKKSYVFGIEQRLIVSGFVQLGICVVIDMVKSKMTYQTDNSKFTRVGVIIMLICFGILTCIQTIRSVKNSSQIEFIRQLAYKDGLTGIGNRTAFNERIEQCTKVSAVDNNICIIMFDLNNLKKANDRHGHQQGDKLLLDASIVIKGIFTKNGEVFRIGGDEFAAILNKDIDEEIIKNLLKELDRKINAFNRKASLPVPLSIAYGYSYSKDGITNLQTLINEADERMYNNKRDMKKNRTIC